MTNTQPEIYGVINAHMIGTETAPGEHVDWTTPDLHTRQEWRELVGDEIEVYAERNQHMIVFLIDADPVPGESYSLVDADGDMWAYDENGIRGRGRWVPVIINGVKMSDPFGGSSSSVGGFEAADYLARTDDGTYSPEHAHVEKSSADCDGSYSSSYIIEANDEELDAELGELEFRNRVLTTIASVWAIEYGATMTVTPEGFEWREQTDEGYSHAEVRWCRDGSCDLEARSQRDHRAESMGY